MPEEIILLISSKLKSERLRLGITLQELANRTGVSKALISQIENNRTLPSLPVLISLIQNLEIGLDTFFQELPALKEEKVLHLKSGQYRHFEKENAVGFDYFRILSKSIASSLVDIVLLQLQPHSYRPKMAKTDAFEFKYIIQGEIEYQIGKETYYLSEGDSLFFDASLPHKPSNKTDFVAKMLIIYFFNEKKV